MSRHRGAVHQIENVPRDLWRRAKARAALEGRPLRSVMLDLLEGYAAGMPTPEPIAPAEAEIPGQPGDDAGRRRPSLDRVESRPRLLTEGT